MNTSAFLAFASLLLFVSSLASHSSAGTPNRPDERLSAYFKAETARLEERCLADIHSLNDWNSRRAQSRAQLFEMLGLDPLPERTELKPVVTGRIEHEDFIVENVQFQSLPGFYVTANLYLPKNLAKTAPAILYLCGHGAVIQNGISYGNKVHYQHHGIWFARHGYVCLVVDTVQLGEIQGIHHGTYREGMWWWNSRGYTSAGVEAWNSMRALDYLETRPEVDAARFGVTGRSGGGAYSWWIAALDDRIKVAAPVAGITDLRNHVVDGVVEGHCDCMFVVNTYRWDYAQVAALVAPRPLLIANTDKDNIFPLEGVVRIHAAVRRIYQLHKASDKLGLLITEGPHKDTQDLQVPVFRWFNRFLKEDESQVTVPAEKLFQPNQLKVLAEIPSDERTSKIHHTFVAKAPTPMPPVSTGEWDTRRQEVISALREKSFAGWPEAAAAPHLESLVSVDHEGLRVAVLEFMSQEHVPLRIVAIAPSNPRKTSAARLQVLQETEWREWAPLLAKFHPAEFRDLIATPANASTPATLLDAIREKDEIVFLFAPRGIGFDAWEGNARKQVQLRRRFMLLGQTLDGMRVWDIRRAMQAIRSSEWGAVPLRVQAAGGMAVNSLYASLFEPASGGLTLHSLPSSHDSGPDYLNVLRVTDIPHVLAMTLEKTPVSLIHPAEGAAGFALETSQRLNWEHRIKFGH
jgi:dienelactone hydrolase